MSFDLSESIRKMRHVEKFLEEHDIDCDDRDLVLKRSFNEAWFSNMLAWLLDPRGSHKLGTGFLREFLKMIAQKRSNQAAVGGSEKPVRYGRKGSFLKWGKEGVGRVTTGLALGNASIAREFYLSSGIGKDKSIGAGYCDVVILDLDSSDGVFVVIENKLFTTNHHQQLEGYQQAVDTKYRRAKIREFVYLTFFGYDPQGSDSQSSQVMQSWIRCSWAYDISKLLTETSPAEPHHEVRTLLIILDWMRQIRENGGESQAKEFRLQILYAAAYCLEGELNRLCNTRGTWTFSEQGGRVTLTHSGNPRSPLKVELLPNLSVAVQGRRRRNASFSKIIVPYGVNADQIFNLLDIAARDIYTEHFGDRADIYLNSAKRRKQSHTCDRKRAVKPLFDYVSAHADALRVLFTVSQDGWRQGRDTADLSEECSEELVI